jgi:glycosyltransferase involved in cell wall biosynthesis
MNIAFVTETYPPEVNGVALTVQSLVQHCRKLGHFVELTRPKQPLDAVQPQHRLIVEHLVEGAELPFYRGLRFGYPAKKQLLKQWRTRRPDGVYVATEGPLGWSAVAAAMALKIPVVTGFHTRFDEFMGHYGLWFLRGAAFAYMRRFHNRALATLVPTYSLQTMLLSRGFRRVERLARAVDTERFAPHFRCASLREQWGVTSDAPCALFVGRIAPEKNLALAVAAFAAIQAHYPNARCVWVGDGPALAGLKATLMHVKTPMGTCAHIFCGMLHDADLAQAYASGDIFLFPSLSETYGNVTLEALASGTPVCAFNYGAAEETIEDQVNGALVRFGDSNHFIEAAVTLAHQTVARRQTLSDAARASVVQLNPAAVATALVRLLSFDPRSENLTRDVCRDSRWPELRF